MTFRYKLPPKPPHQRLNRLPPGKAAENLTGVVKGKKASDLEERWARALNKDEGVTDYTFQYIVTTPYEIPGQKNSVDFVIQYDDQWWAIEIDGTFVHKTANKRAEDRLRDAFVNEQLRKDGIQPIQRVAGEELQTQDAADRAERQVLRG